MHNTPPRRGLALNVGAVFRRHTMGQPALHRLIAAVLDAQNARGCNGAAKYGNSFSGSVFDGVVWWAHVY